MKMLNRLTQTQLIVLGFLLVISAGTLLLCLPVSSRSGEFTPFLDSLFTSTSATCVTGLVVVDTYSHWSLFGQLVILFMIQIGGLGFMTVVSMFSVFSKKRIGLAERNLLIAAAGTVRASGVRALIKRVFLGTLAIEGAGALLLSFRFIPQFGAARGIYYSIFHSVSAFCNAGFDLMGVNSPFSSMTHYRGDVLVNFTLVALIIIGGIGFFVWSDISKNKWHFKKYELHTKIVLVTSAVLVLGGWLLFYIFESDASLKGMGFGEKVMASLFGSVSPRTAGFNTVELSSLSDSGSMLSNVLMLIGGSPGSTAGGLKTTTVAVMILSVAATVRKQNGITVFKRTLDESSVKQASSIIALYLCVFLAAVMTICALEPFPLKAILFEVSSAVATVGSTMGITPEMSSASHIILILLMFFGRIGGASFMLILAERRTYVPLKRPTDKILIG